MYLIQIRCIQYIHLMQWKDYVNSFPLHCLGHNDKQVFTCSIEKQFLECFSSELSLDAECWMWWASYMFF
jgi:hypothetical protein